MRCVSLFSGCGGLDLGFRDAGFEIVAAVDFDDACVRTHAMNFPGTTVLQRDIAAWSADSMRQDLPGSALGADVLVAGPPCPPFSKSRYWRTDLPRGFADPKGADSFEAFIRALGVVQPRAFLLENVRGLTYKGNRVALDYLVNEAARLGYRGARWRVLNAADFGVPQIRERCFVVGFRDGSGFDFPEPTHDQIAADGKAPWVTAGDVLNDIDTEEFADKWGHTAGGRFKHLLEELPPGENYLYFTAERGHPNPQFKYRSRFWTYLLKLSPDKPSWTIQAKRTNNMGPLHWRNRVLRIEEIKRLQTFPDDFVLTGDVNKKWRQVGNAVPPRLAQALAESIMQALLAKNECLTKVA